MESWNMKMNDGTRVTGVRAVLFDLDNTLLLENESTERALRDASASIGRIGGDVEILASAARDAAEQIFRESSVFAYADAMGIWWGEALWGEFLGETGGLQAMRAFVPDFRLRVWTAALASVGIDDERLIQAAVDAFRSARQRNQLVDPEAAAVVRDLARDHLLRLGTNGAPGVQREKLSRPALASFLEITVLSAEIRAREPDPRIFQAAL